MIIDRTGVLLAVARCVSDHEDLLYAASSPVLHQAHFEATNDILRDIFASLGHTAIHEVFYHLNVLSKRANTEPLIVFVISESDEAYTDNQRILSFLLALGHHAIDDFTECFPGPFDPRLHRFGGVKDEAKLEIVGLLLTLRILCLFSERRRLFHEDLSMRHILFLKNRFLRSRSLGL